MQFVNQMKQTPFAAGLAAPPAGSAVPVLQRREKLPNVGNLAEAYRIVLLKVKSTKLTSQKEV
jgi:hypothetical protein